MAVYILKRVGLALITLWILSIIVFWAGQQLPGDPGRTILGNLATPAGVAALDHKLGVDRPLVTQYKDWVTTSRTATWGTSYSYQAPIRPFITSAPRQLTQARRWWRSACACRWRSLSGVIAAPEVWWVGRPHDQRVRAVAARPA